MRKLFALLCTLSVGLAAQAQLNVSLTSTLGTTTAASYSNLGAAFAKINDGTHQGAIVISITGNTNEGTTAATLNSTGVGSASYSSVVIRPTTSATITGSPAQGMGIIQLNGADNVTIDGDIEATAGTTERALTITNISSNTYTSLIRVATGTGNTSANGITIRNLTITGSISAGNASAVTSSTGNASTQFGIIAGPNGGTSAPTAITSVTGAMATGMTVNDFTVNNCVINQVGRGIAFMGTSSGQSSLVTITNNIIGGAATLSGNPPFTAPAATVYTRGIVVIGAISLNLSDNVVRNVISYIGSNIMGIEVSSAGLSTNVQPITINNNTVDGVCNNTSGFWTVNGMSIATVVPAQIKGNTIRNVYNPSGSAVTGLTTSTSSTAAQTLEIANNRVSTIYVGSTSTARGITHTSGNNTFTYNNFVWDVRGNTLTSVLSTSVRAGIAIAGGTGHKVYHNSVHLSGTPLSGTGNDVTAAFAITTTAATGVDVRNNIFSNNMSRNAGNTSAFNRSAMMLPGSPSSAMNLTLNNNAYYSSSDTLISTIGTSGVFYRASNFNPALRTPATNARALTSALNTANTANDSASFGASTLAPFLGATNLQVDGTSVDAFPLYGGDNGVVTANSALLFRDIDGNSRPLNGSVPLMGAHEVLLPVCDGGNVEAGSPNSSSFSICQGTSTNIIISNQTTGLGVSYQWYTADAAGTLGSPISGATTTTLSVGSGLTPGMYYYIFTATCSGTTQNSALIEVEVKSNPVVSVTPATGTYCSPGGTPVELTASGATTYSWSPATGLSAATGASVNATPSIDAVYTVTGTTNGCTATATATITSLANPVLGTLTATPSSICAGGTSNLVVSASLIQRVNRYSTSASTGATLDPMTGATQALTTGNDDTPGSPADIGFSFPYEGVNYTRFAVSPDGWIMLGSNTFTAAPGSQFTNAITSATNVPKIYPYWDDLATGTNGNVRYVVTGTAPNRILKVQWFVTIPRNTTGAATATFQAWLYETSGRIEFRYGTMGSGSMSASVGVTGATSTDFSSVSVSGNTFSTTTANDANAGQPASGTMYVFEPGAITSYSWTPADFLSNTNTANPQVTSAFNATTTYTVAVTAVTGCTQTGSVTVSLSSGAPSLSGLSFSPSSTVCPGTAVTISDNRVGGCGPYLYRLFRNASQPSDTLAGGSGALVYSGATFTGANATVAPTATTNYLLVVIDNNGNAGTQAFTVNVHTVAPLVVTPANPYVCIGTPASLSVSGGTSYRWSPITGLSDTASANTQASPAATTTYTVTSTDGNGCPMTGTATVRVSRVSATSIQAAASEAAVCAGGSVNLTSTLFATGGNAAQFSMIASNGATLDPMTGATQAIGTGVDDGASSTYAFGFNFPFEGTSYSHFAVASDGWIRLLPNSTTTATGQFTNAITSTTNVPKIYPYWDDLATGTNGNVSYVITGTAPNRILKVQWFVTIPRNTTGAATATFQAWLYETSGRIEFRYGTMGSGSMSASVGITGATATNFTSVTVSGNTFSNSNANDANAGQPASGTMYTIVQRNPAGFTYAWSPASFLSDASLANPVASNITSATSWTVTATDSLGCSVTSAPVSVAISSGAPSLSALTVSADSVCRNGSTTIQANLSGGCAPFLYRLFRNASQASDTLAGGSASLVYSGATFSGSNATLTHDSTRSFYLVVYDNAGNSDSRFFTVVVRTPAPITFSPAAPTICSGNPVTITASGASNLTWTPATGLNTTTGATVVASGSTTTYRVSGTDTYGCAASDTVVVTNVPAVVVNTTASPQTICAGQSASLSANPVRLSSVATYGFQALNGASLDPMTGATEAVPSNTADATSTPAAIGFTFPYEGTNYTRFSVSPDGWLMLGNNSFTAAPSTQNTNTVTSTTNVPKIYPYWDNLHTGTNGNVRWVVTGTAPDRILKVQWFVVNTSTALAGANSTFQAWLYETSGRIEFRYGTVGTGTVSASIGVTGATASNYLSVSLPANTASSTSANNSITGSPASGTMFVFMPPTSTYTYSWSPATFLSATNVANPTASNVTSTTNYTVTVTDAAGCTYQAGIPVTISAQPISVTSVTSAQNGFCASAGISTTLTGIISGGCPPYNYTWKIGDSVLNTTSSNLLSNQYAVSPTSTTVYTLVVTDQNNNSASQTVTVSVTNPQPASVTGASRCGAGTVSLSATAAAGETIRWYAAASGGTSLGTGATFTTPVVTATTNFFVSVQSGGCEGTRVPVQALVNPAPAFSATPNTTVCNNTVVALSVTSDTTSFDNYTWSPVSNLFLDSACTQAYTANTRATRVFMRTTTAGSYSYTVLATQTGGDQCGGSATTIVSVQPASGTLSTATNPICVSGNPAVVLSGSGYRAPFLTWERSTDSAQWNVVIPSATGTVYTETNALTVTAWYRVAVRDSLGVTCFNAAPFKIVVNTPTLTVNTPSVTRCGPGAVTLTATPNTGSTISWFTAATGGTAVSTSATFTPTVTATTKYYVSAGVGSCQTPRDSVTVTVTTPPAITITGSPLVSGNTSICNGSSATLTVSSANAGYSYRWSPIGTLSDSIGATVSASPTVSTTYTVSAVDTSGGANNGCAAVATIAVNVRLGGVTVVAGANILDVCSGGSVTLADTISGIGTLPTYTAPTQSGGSCITLVQFHTLNSSPAACVSPFYRSNAATGNNTTTVQRGATYTLNVAAADAIVSVWIDYDRDGSFEASEWNQVYTSGSSGSVAITIPNTAAGGATGMRIRSRNTNNQNGAGDAGTSFGSGSTEDYTIFISAPNAAIPGFARSWTLNGQVVGTTSPLTVSPPATSTYVLTITDSTTGCSISSNVTINVGAPLTVNASASLATVCAGSASTLQSSVAGGGQPYAYSWRDAGNNVVGTTASVSVNPTQTTTYTLTVTDACSNSASASVTVNTTPLPTVSLSPDGVQSICSLSQQFTASTNAGAASYQWLLNGGTISGATASTYTATQPGQYSVRVTDGVTTCLTTSAAATLNFLNAPAPMTVAATGGTTACVGTPLTLTTTATALLLSEDFGASTPGWTITNNSVSSTGATITNVNWVYQSSPYTEATGSATFSGFRGQGTHFAFSQSDAGGSGSRTRTALSSPSFSTRGYGAAKVHYRTNFRRWSSDSLAAVQVTVDGVNWQNIKTYTADYGTTTNNGQTLLADSADLPAAALNQASVRIRYNYVSTWGYYWIVDSVRVVGTPLSTNFAWTASPANGAGLTAGQQTASTGNGAITVTPTEPGTYVYTVTSSVANSTCDNTSTITITVNRPSVAADSVFASSVLVCPGTAVTLTQRGGVLGTGATWRWYSDAGFTDLVGSSTAANASLVVTPNASTTYYLRAEGTTAPCTAQAASAASVTVNMHLPATGGTASSSQTLCSGSTPASLDLLGHKGTILHWQSATDTAFTQGVITYNNTTTTLSGTEIGALNTTRYFRAVISNSGCSTVYSSVVTITVRTRTVAPTALNASTTQVCSGGLLTLTQSGGSLGSGAYWQWYRDAAFTDAVGGPITAANAQLQVNQVVNTTYYLRAEGGTAPCPVITTAADSIRVFIAADATASISYSGSPYCGASGFASPTIVGTQGGSFSSTAGLSINAQTGIIDLGLSQAGTYTVTYTFSGGPACAVATTFTQVEIRPSQFFNTVPTSQLICAGSTVATINLGSVPGITYLWSNTNSSIGLADTGRGNIQSFVAVNNGSSDQQARITVRATGGTGCFPTPLVFGITVSPGGAQINAIPNQVVCAGQSTTAVNFTTAQGATLANWSTNNPGIGVVASVTNSPGIPSFIARNPSGADSTVATFTVTPVRRGCSGTPVQFTITVRNSATSLSYPQSTYCQNTGALPILRAGAGGTFSATPSGLTIDANTGRLNLWTSLAGTYTVTYTLGGAAGCGSSVSTQVTVLPRATVTPSVSVVGVCRGGVFPEISFTGTGTAYNWTNSNTAIGLAASGSGNIASFVGLNATATVQRATVTVTAIGNGTTTCNSQPTPIYLGVHTCNAATVTQAGGTGGDASTLRTQDVTLSPVPARNTVTVTYQGTMDGPLTVQMVSQWGSSLMRPAQMTTNTHTLDVSGLTPGTYVVQVVNPRTGQSVQKQLIKL